MYFFLWLLAILIAAGAAWWVYRADKRRAVPQPWLTALLRGLVLLSAALLVLAPDMVVTKNNTELPVIALLQDNSTSAGTALGGDSAQVRKDIVALSGRLAGKYKVVQWGFGDRTRKDSLYSYDLAATDISAALNSVTEFYGMQNLGAIILASDGRFNRGINPLYLQSAYQGTVYTVAYGDSITTRDIRLSRTYANRTASLNSEFEIRADVIAEQCRGYNNAATLKEGTETIGSVPLQVSNDRFDRSVSFSVKTSTPGLHHYVLQLPTAEGETNTANNRRDIFVEVVDEKKKILLLAEAPHPDLNAIKEALSGTETYKVELATADKMPASLAGYDAIVLHGLPSPRHHIGPMLIAAHKPLWLILSVQTDIAAVNSMREITHTGVAPAAIHEAPVSYRSTFNAFTVPQRIRLVADKMPPLLSHSGNIIAAPGANVLFTQRTPAGEMPAWVMQHTGVPTVILAGEGLWRWRMYEYRHFDNHDVIDECIRQTIAFLCAGNNGQPFSVHLQQHVWSDQEPVAMNATLLNANNEPVNDPEAKITITDSAGHKEGYTFERSGTDYNLNIGIHAGGKYTYKATTTFNGKELTTSGSFVVETIPLEQMETGADFPLLYKLAHQYAGAFTTASNITSLYDSIVANKKIVPVIRTTTETVPLVERKWYFVLILLLATAEWLLRKYWLAQ